AKICAGSPAAEPSLNNPRRIVRDRAHGDGPSLVSESLDHAALVPAGLQSSNWTPPDPRRPSAGGRFFARAAHGLGEVIEPRSSHGSGHDLVGLGDDAVQVDLVAETLGVNLVDVLGAGGPRGKPTTPGNDLEPANCRVISGSAGQLGRDRLAGEVSCLDV